MSLPQHAHYKGLGTSRPKCNATIIHVIHETRLFAMNVDIV